MLISFIRTVILYASIVISMRLLGKRQIGELEPSELAITVMLSELASVPMQDLEQPLAVGLVPIATLVVLGVLMSFLSMKSGKWRKLISGKPSIIICNGQTDLKELRRLRLNTDEVNEGLRLKNVEDIKIVKFGILETNGQLSIVLKEGSKPLTSGEFKTGGGAK